MEDAVDLFFHIVMHIHIEAFFHNWIKRVIVTFSSHTFCEFTSHSFDFFSDLRDMNSQLRVLKSELWVFIYHSILRRKSQKSELKHCNYLFFYYYSVALTRHPRVTDYQKKKKWVGLFLWISFWWHVEIWMDVEGWILKSCIRYVIRDQSGIVPEDPVKNNNEKKYINNWWIVHNNIDNMLVQYRTADVSFHANKKRIRLLWSQLIDNFVIEK